MKVLGKTGIEVTPVGMGVLTVGRTQLDLPIDEGAEIVRYALKQGINFLDTAEYYETYPYIRRALEELKPELAKGVLPRPVISSKSLAADYAGMERAIEDCRRELDMDMIDIFLLHEVAEGGDFERRRGAWDCLLDAKTKGYVKAIGISTHYVGAAADAAKIYGLDVLFPIINYKGLGIRNGGAPGAREDMEEAIRSAAARGIGVFAMKVLGGGHLAPDYKAALDYAGGLPGVTSLMLGMGRKKDVDDAILWAKGRLPAAFAPDVTNKRIFIDRGDCEGCGACAARCTSKAIHLDNKGIAVINNEICIICGYCAPVCPTRALIYL